MEQRHHTTLTPSNSMLVPLPSHRQLAVVPPSSRIKVPLGWGIEEVPRSDGYRSDTYYYEPETGRKFRSSKEVERYLNGLEYTPRRSPRKLTPHNHNSGVQIMIPYGAKNSACRWMIVSGGKMLRLDDEELSGSHLAIVASTNAAPEAPFILPDGWIVEEVPRKFYDNCFDKYYYEPGTGQKFRSLVAVERYLAELEENAPLSKTLEEIKENKPLSKVFKLRNHSKYSTPRKKNISGNNKQVSSFVNPPMKVNWVLAGPQGDAWNPFISDTLVPDSVKEQWTNSFIELMNDGIDNILDSHA